MKANKKTLLAFKSMMENETEAYGYEELVQTCVDETKMNLKYVFQKACLNSK